MKRNEFEMLIKHNFHYFFFLNKIVKRIERSV